MSSSYLSLNHDCQEVDEQVQRCESLEQQQEKRGKKKKKLEKKKSVT